MSTFTVQKSSPSWRQLRSEGLELRSPYDYDRHLIEKCGYKRRQLAGRTGKGADIHLYTVLCKEDNEVLHVASLLSYCGSDRLTGMTELFNPTHETLCTCKRCGVMK